MLQTISGSNSSQGHHTFTTYVPFFAVSGQQGEESAIMSDFKTDMADVVDSSLLRKVVNPAAATTWMDRHQEDEIKFQRLAAEWAEQRGASSSLTEIVLCEAYQSIIGMGKRAVPHILRQIRSEGDDPDQWFWALRMITLQDPVASEDRGNFVKMAQSWLEWGERNWHVW